jgi:hypothetical protein
MEMNIVPLEGLHKVFRHLSVDFHTPEMLNRIKFPRGRRIAEERWKTCERITPAELLGRLRPGFPWGDIVILAVTDSTNRVAMEMAENGAKHGTVIVDAVAVFAKHHRARTGL